MLEGGPAAARARRASCVRRVRPGHVEEKLASFCFSTAPIMQARPLGSTARYSPGTMRRAPDLPNVSWCTCERRAPHLSTHSRSRCLVSPVEAHSQEAVPADGRLTLMKEFFSLEYSRMTMRPESEPTTM